MRIVALFVIGLITIGCNANPIPSSKEFKIIDKPIDFGVNRIEGTKKYIKTHYGLDVKDIKIKPRIIVLHWTAIPTMQKSYDFLKPENLGARPELVKAGNINVSSHFLVDRDGTIYRLMSEDNMARHIIGLNYNAIGIENVGGANNKQEDLTNAQVQANVYLVRYLKAKYPQIEILMGHHEYDRMKNTQYWLERDNNYFTEKKDPGNKFMREVRSKVKDLELLTPPPCKDCR
jgi:beta-N-acetylhexosaminidase